MLSASSILTLAISPFSSTTPLHNSRQVFPFRREFIFELFRWTRILRVSFDTRWARKSDRIFSSFLGTRRLSSSNISRERLKTACVTSELHIPVERAHPSKLHLSRNRCDKSFISSWKRSWEFGSLKQVFLSWTAYNGFTFYIRRYLFYRGIRTCSSWQFVCRHSRAAAALFRAILKTNSCLYIYSANLIYMCIRYVAIFISTCISR